MTASGPGTDSPTAAILVAAGRSQRMHGIDKTLAPLAGRPTAAWSIEVFARCDAIHTIVLVSGEKNHEALQSLGVEFGRGKVLAVVPGGARRQDSVANGLRALEPAASTGLVAIHDIARPLTTESTILRGLELAAEHGAAVASVAITDTVKHVNEDGVIERTIDRNTVRAVQTPQVFRLDLLRRAHATFADSAANVDGSPITDDAMLVEALGHSVLAYESDGPNLKITTAIDIAVAEMLLTARLRPVGDS